MAQSPPASVSASYGPENTSAPRSVTPVNSTTRFVTVAPSLGERTWSAGGVVSAPAVSAAVASGIVVVVSAAVVLDDGSAGVDSSVVVVSVSSSAAVVPGEGSAIAIVVEVARSAPRTGATARASTAEATRPEMRRSTSSVSNSLFSAADSEPPGVNAARPIVAMRAMIKRPARISGMRDRTGEMLRPPACFGEAISRHRRLCRNGDSAHPSCVTSGYRWGGDTASGLQP